MSSRIYFSLALLLAFFVATAISAPTNDHANDELIYDEHNPMETIGMFQGDIAVDPVPRFRTSRKDRLWDDGIVHYNISDELGKLLLFKLKNF